MRIYYSLVVACFVLLTADKVQAQEQAPVPVRNQVAVTTGTPITTMRHWKIKKGSFPQFLHASQTGVWPYFEKIGARVVGMWQVINVKPDDKAGGMENSGFTVHQDNGLEYDEAILVTRYASVEHWQATRDAVALGGNGPDYQALVAALRARQDLTLETSVTFLQGFSGPNGPYFLPGTGELFQAEDVGR